MSDKMEQILYESTRGAEKGVTASRAVLNGLAGDGGLYVPDHFPKLDVPFDKLKDMDYRQVAYEVMSRFLTDYTEEELKACINSAYDNKFDTPEIAPLKKADGSYFLELFHGATIAFKDMALSILPHLMTTAAKKNQITEKIVILTATSGDTGKAAMAGFADVPGTEIIVFFPKDGVSPVQKRQMVTQRGENTHVVAIKGNFDDAQTGVKKMFNDKALAAEMKEHGFVFSSANSINIGRLIPQAAYYVYAYVTLIRQGVIKAGEEINVTDPTGNFGNILAAYYAKQMGLPFHKLICASNENKVLFDFFRTGTYDRNRPFILTSSPSMDILVSSNLERLLWYMTDDTAIVKRWMTELAENGSYDVGAEVLDKIKDTFSAGCADDERTKAVIREVYEKEDYVLDPHTAVAWAVAEDYSKANKGRCVTVLSTASPYKFCQSVLEAVGENVDNKDTFYMLDRLSDINRYHVPAGLAALRTAEVLHSDSCRKEEMPDMVLDFAQR